jgi:predicted TIM-barrel fold metal-dependent hydrolase
MDPPGSSPAAVREELLDAGGVGAAQLVAVEAPAHALQSRNYDLSSSLGSAFNDYLLDEWVVDERMRYALMVMPNDPVAAVAEIRRHGDDRRVSSVWIPAGQRLLGDRLYDPVYAAAAERGLPIFVHPGGPGTAMPTPAYSFEGRANAPLRTWSNIASLVAHGAAERFPGLVFVFAECGFSWLPALLERMDAAWRKQREQLPELKRAPSEIARAQVRLTTSPLDDDRDGPALGALIEEPGSHLDDVLLYASNYPRAGSGLEVFGALSERARRKVLFENAHHSLRI